MKNRIIIVMALFGLWLAQPAFAQRQDACASTVGTYLATLTNEATGEVSSRAIMTFAADGNLFVIDSNQGAGLTGPFSDQQGTWVCRRPISATTLDFSFPSEDNPGDIARLDFWVTQNSVDRISGRVELRFFPLNSDLQENVPSVATFSFSGKRLRTR